MADTPQKGDFPVETHGDSYSHGDEYPCSKDCYYCLLNMVYGFKVPAGRYSPWGRVVSMQGRNSRLSFGDSCKNGSIMSRYT